MDNQGTTGFDLAFDGLKIWGKVICPIKDQNWHKAKSQKVPHRSFGRKMLVYFHFCRFTCTYEQRGKFLKKMWCCVGERV